MVVESEPDPSAETEAVALALAESVLMTLSGTVLFAAAEVMLLEDDDEDEDVLDEVEDEEVDVGVQVEELDEGVGVHAGVDEDVVDGVHAWVDVVVGVQVVVGVADEVVVVLSSWYHQVIDRTPALRSAYCWKSCTVSQDSCHSHAKGSLLETNPSLRRRDKRDTRLTCELCPTARTSHLTSDLDPANSVAIRLDANVFPALWTGVSRAVQIGI